MNREILFKAKRLDNGEWVEGFLFKQQLELDAWCIGTRAISANDFSEIYGEFSDWFKIDPDTICQYTGLNDNTKWEELTELEKELFLSNWNYQQDRKNKVEDWKGKKIWENDIVRFNKCSNYPVVWNEGYCAFGSCYYSDFDYLSKYRNDEMEVVGNIFDDKDLLEVE